MVQNAERGGKNMKQSNRTTRKTSQGPNQELINQWKNEVKLRLEAHRVRDFDDAFILLVHRVFVYLTARKPSASRAIRGESRRAVVTPSGFQRSLRRSKNRETQHNVSVKTTYDTKPLFLPSKSAMQRAASWCQNPIVLKHL
jgi:hypothetical protein